MKPYALIVAALLLLVCGRVTAAEGDDAPDYKSFSLELGTGIQPLHMTFAPTMDDQRKLAKLGQRYENGETSYCPTFSLSEVWRVAPHWEICLTEGISWKIMAVTQYESFGTGPSGEPRYDLDKGSPIGWKSTTPVGSMTVSGRFIWSPKWAVTVYSALGVGMTTASEFIPLPEVTPVAFRFGKDHFYTFAEVTIGPIASIAHIGLGWRF